MMDRETLTRTMAERPLKISEVLGHAYALMSNRFGSYLGLSLLVFIPASALLQYFTMKVSVQVPEMEQLLNGTADLAVMERQMLYLLISNVCVTFLTLIAIMVSAVMVKNQLFDEENKTFGVLFYRGVRMWPRGALTLVLVMIEFFLAVFGCAMLMLVPLVGLLSFLLMALAAVWFVMYQNLCGCGSALRGRLGFDNMRYVRFLLSGFMKKEIGTFAVIILISEGVTLIVNLLTSNFLYISDNLWVQFAISVAISGIISVLNTYGYVCGTLVFLNLEEVQKARLRKIRSESGNEAEKLFAEEALRSMAEAEGKDPDEEQEENEDEGENY